MSMNEIQKKIFNIYLTVKDICERNSLRYWAIGGTCLGAIRHKGFIPWDFDMDLALPDEDYQKFIEIAKKELKGTDYEIRSRLIGDMVTRVFDSTTTEIAPSNKKYPERFVGVHVDIMPFCGMPKKKWKRKAYAFNIGMLHFLDAKRVRSLKDCSTFKGRISWCLSSPIHLFTDQDYFFRKWNKKVNKYKYDDSEYTCFLWSDFRYSTKLILKTSWFNDWIEVPYETSTIRCPKDYDIYLKTQYGDYMTPPLENEKGESDGWFIDLNRPYKYYQEHGDEIK